MRIAVAVGFLAYSSIALAAETFSFDIPEPRLRIVVPDIPQVKMGVHPNAGAQPHARFMGSDDTGYTISILLPIAAEGMTPRDCARSAARSIVNRFAVDPKYIVAIQANETTFVMLFPYRADPAIQFKAFLLSGYRGTHCVEVHVSRTMMPGPEKAMAEDLAKWFQGFRAARIETY